MTSFSSTAARFAGLMSLLGALFLFAAGQCAANPIVEFGLPTVGAAPEGITFGPDGAYWFTEFFAGKIGRITTNGVITEYFLPSGSTSEPMGIVTGPDTNLWFTEYNVHRLGRITTNGTITEFVLPTGLFPNFITLGVDGRLWVTDFGGELPPTGATTNGGILAVTLGTNGVTNLSYYNSNFTVGSRPQNIINGPNGNLYFTEQAAGKIGSITTNGVITESGLLPTNCDPYDLTTGPDGALWFTEANTNMLGRIDAAFTVTNQYPLPTNVDVSILSADQPLGIIVGPDKNIYYTDPPFSCVTRVNLTSNAVSLVTNATIITNIIGLTTNYTTNFSTNVNASQFYTPTTNSYPRHLATGADGNIWFGEFVGDYPAYINNIGEFIMPVPLSILLTNNSQVVLSWTTNITTNFVLQTNSDLTTTNWGFTTNVPAVIGNRYIVTNPVAGNLFYRLID